MEAARLGPAERIELDGQLDDPAWARAPSTGEFVERVPTPGDREIASSEFRVVFDSSALYVAVRAPLNPGEVPRATEYRRDQFDIYTDEVITLKVDVLRDRRTSIGFAVNPAGTQLDFVVVENGRQVIREFDVVWNAATKTEEAAWIAEFEIPFAALGLPRDVDGADRVIGLNVTRDRSSEFSTFDWSPMLPEFGPYSAPHYGALGGVRNVGGGLPVSLIPYLLVGYGGGPRIANADLRGSAGGEVQVRVADTYWVQLTAFTDSAQVELDDPAVNLDRFPLFFPERRPFFLTGFDAFRFGRERVSQPFFSRRVGLTADARQAWVYGGAKSFGRLGPLSLGVLDVVAEDTTGVATNHAVLRPRLEIDGPSYIGAIGTVRHTFGQNGSANVGVTAGLDTLIRTSDQRYELSGFGTFSAAEGASLGWDGELAARHMGTNFQPKLTVAATSADYNPLLGFVRRSDFVRVNLVTPFVFRGVPRIREIWVTGVAETGLSYTTGDVSYSFGSIGADLTGTSEWYFRSELAFTRDKVAAPFDLPGGYNVKPGDYEGVSFRVSADSAPREVVAVSASFLVNDGFFGGTSQTIGGALRLLVAPHLRLSISPSVSFLQFPNGQDHVATTLQVPFTWTPSTTVQFDGALQLNTETSTFTSLARLRWRYAPGSDAYLVYRQETAYKGTAPTDQSVTLKLIYRWDGLM